MMADKQSLSIEEIAELAGCDVQTIESYVASGMFDREKLTAEDVAGMRLIGCLVDSGIPFETISKMFDAKEISSAFLRDLTAFSVTLKRQTYIEAMADLGLEPDYIERIFVAAGIPKVDLHSKIRSDDLEFLQILASVGPFSIPEDMIGRILRTFGHSLRKNAEAMRDLFRDEIEERQRARNESFDSFLQNSARTRLPLQRAGLAVVEILQRRILEEMVFENVATRFQEHLHVTGRLEKETRDQPAVAFADIVDFTLLTLEKGDREAFRYVSRFEAHSQEILRPIGVRVIKSLGDGLLLHSPSVGAAVEGCLELVRSTEAAGLPEIRVGLAAGPIVFRDGDVFGTTVNLASRLADKARSSEILTHSTVVNDRLAGAVRWTPLGRTPLKGLGPVDVYSSAPSANRPAP